MLPVSKGCRRDSPVVPENALAPRGGKKTRRLASRDGDFRCRGCLAAAVFPLPPRENRVVSSERMFLAANTAGNRNIRTCARVHEHSYADTTELLSATTTTTTLSLLRDRVTLKWFSGFLSPRGIRGISSLACRKRKLGVCLIWSKGEVCLNWDA